MSEGVKLLGTDDSGPEKAQKKFELGDRLKSHAVDRYNELYAAKKKE